MLTEQGLLLQPYPCYEMYRVHPESEHCGLHYCRGHTVFPISVRPIRLTGIGAQCILGQTGVEFTKKLAL